MFFYLSITLIDLLLEKTSSKTNYKLYLKIKVKTLSEKYNSFASRAQPCLIKSIFHLFAMNQTSLFAKYNTYIELIAEYRGQQHFFKKSFHGLK